MYEFMKGNQYASKWTKEKTLEKLSEIIDFLENNEGVYTIGSALLHVKLYDEWWAYITNKFKDDADVFKSIKSAEKVIENRIVNDTMTGDAKSAAFSIFLLKNKFEYVDKQEIKSDTNITGINLKDLVKFE